ncbi:MAG: hypothetical protein PUD20_11560 [bacterium]|nr:hypothetical protein [bacterium]
MCNYERSFRSSLGFTNQEKLKKYFKATDFVVVNWDKINQCNARLKEICEKINRTISSDIQIADIDEFTNKINEAFVIMRDNNIFPRLNNQGRNPDDVYYNWMRGYLICEMFIPAIARIFGIPEENILHTGQDDLTNLETFARAATADLEIITVDNERIRLEMQAGYTGTNDIKRSKILEAISKKQNDNINTYVVHIDVFNGKAAIIDISNADDSRLNYHKAFENTDVLTINPEWFVWKLANPLPELNTVITSI